MKSVRLGPAVRIETWYEFAKRKNGAPGKRVVAMCAYYTPLRVCDRCGRIGTPKKVQYRARCYHFTQGKDMLCMACWNRVRPLANMAAEIEELGYLQRKLEREARKCRHQLEN